MVYNNNIVTGRLFNIFVRVLNPAVDIIKTNKSAPGVHPPPGLMLCFHRSFDTFFFRPQANCRLLTHSDNYIPEELMNCKYIKSVSN